MDKIGRPCNSQFEIPAGASGGNKLDSRGKKRYLVGRSGKRSGRSVSNVGGEKDDDGIGDDVHGNSGSVGSDDEWFLT